LSDAIVAASRCQAADTTPLMLRQPLSLPLSLPAASYAHG